MVSRPRIAHQIGSTLRRLRRERGMSQRQLAGPVGISRAALSDIERGRRTPDVAAFARLLAALCCTEDAFARHFGPFGEVEAIRRRGAV